MSISKVGIQTVQDLSHLLHVPPADEKPSHPLARPQRASQVPSSPSEPEGSYLPLVPEQGSGANTPGEAPGYLAWKQLAGTKVWLGWGHSHGFRNYLGIILAPCLHSVENTADV